MDRGKFITLEALDGAGKSTALAGIVEQLEARGIEVVVTREPGGTERGEAIRAMLLDPSPTEALSHDTELLMMFAARAQHLDELIRPALERGAWVVSDRFTDSSFGYQGGGRGVDTQRIEMLERFVQGELQPDLTFLLDLPESAAQERRQQRFAATGDRADRFEQEASAFFSRVREAYLDRADHAPERISVVNAAQSIPEVQRDIETVLDSFCDAAGVNAKPVEAQPDTAVGPVTNGPGFSI